MSAHDSKIKALLTEIETKRNKVGDKPRATWKSNGIYKFEDGTHVNINTINHTDRCVEVVAHLLQKQSFLKDAAKVLGVVYQSPVVEDYIDDFKLRASMITWDGEKRKLDLLESKLKDLRSEDAKTSDALTDIMSQLQ